jgi:hypothetical protein
LQPHLVSAAASDDNGDTCCGVDKKAKVTKLAKLTRLEIPSSESMKRADLEMTSNLHKSLSESKISYLTAAFAVSDAEINSMFKAETSISTPATAVADEVMDLNFQAENIAMNANVIVADDNIDALFTVFEKGIQMRNNQAFADDWMTTSFLAEHIALPSAEMISKADNEISKQQRLGSAHNVALIK